MACNQCGQCCRAFPVAMPIGILIEKFPDSKDVLENHWKPIDTPKDCKPFYKNWKWFTCDLLDGNLCSIHGKKEQVMCTHYGEKTPQYGLIYDDCGFVEDIPKRCPTCGK